jgi:hypothetical protein
MVPIWLHLLAMASLALALLCAGIIAIDEMRDPQHMGIMNLVWPLVALFGSVAVLWLYRRYGKLATHRAVIAAKRSGHESPNKARTPFAIMVAKGAAHCGSGCTLGDICAEWLAALFPVIAVWFGWHVLFAEKMFAVWILDFLFAYMFGVAFQYFTIAPMRARACARDLAGNQSRYAIADRVAGRHVWLHGLRWFVPVSAGARHPAADAVRRILVHDADCDAVRLSHQLSGELVAYPLRN